MTDADLQRIADELGEPIEIVREMSDALACCADEGPLEARTDRRQRAREAYYDACAEPGRVEGSAIALETAIETAMRVRITPEIILAYLEAPDPPESDPDMIEEKLRAAFRAAGFEVEQ